MNISLQFLQNGLWGLVKIQYNSCMIMEKEDSVSCFCFERQNYMVICSLNEDMVKVRLEMNNKQGEEQMYLLTIRADQFPDYLRQASVKDPKEIYDYLYHSRYNKNVLTFQSRKIIILLSQGQLIEFKPNRFKVSNSQPIIQIGHSSVPPIWDLSTKSSKSYQIEGRKVIKKNIGWLQLVKLNEFMSHDKFKFRVLQYGGILSIGFGVISQKRKQYQYSGDIGHLQSLGYWSRKGYKKGCICQNGTKSYQWDQDLFIDINQQCCISMDKDHKIITFQNKIKSIECKIHSIFHGNPLFVFIVMHDVASAIQVL